MPNFAYKLQSYFFQTEVLILILNGEPLENNFNSLNWPKNIGCPESANFNPGPAEPGYALPLQAV